MLLKRINLRLIIYLFEGFRVPAKAAYSTPGESQLGGLFTLKRKRARARLPILMLGVCGVAFSAWPDVQYRRDIGFTKFGKDGWTKCSSPA